MYKLFLSYSLSESAIAKELNTQLNNAFMGNLVFFSASEQLASGVDWKKAIRDALNECEAGLFILTPKYQKSMWSVSEFTAFWLDDKPMFLICIGEIDRDNLYYPMRDYQIADISNVDEMKRLLERLSVCLGEKRIPYPSAEAISKECTLAYLNLLEKNQEDLYRELTTNTKNKLDKSDKYLLLDIERFRKAIFFEPEAIVLRNVIIKALDQNKHVEELRYAIDHLSVINNAELRKVAIRLIQSSNYENSVFEHCITALALQSQPELIKVLRVLNFIDQVRYRYYVDEKHVVTDSKYKKRLENWINQNYNGLDYGDPD